MQNKNEPTPEQIANLLKILENRFKNHMHRHEGINWNRVEERLRANIEKLSSLFEMEASGGEPDVIKNDENTGEYIFYDCAVESPKGRRSVCYDHEALASRKKHKPANSAVGMAADMGIELLTEEQYRELQQTGNYDTKTSGWLKTPEEVRQMGGAIFGDRRYGRVFIYHNGAESYYASRGFRGMLKI